MRIIERKSLPTEEPYILTGLPDIGLVGTIASLHIIRQLNMEEMAYVESDELPPVVVLHKGHLKMPIRIYGHDRIYIVTSEIAISPNVMPLLAKNIVDYAMSKNAKAIIMLGGLAVPNRLEIEKPKVYAVATLDEILEQAKNIGIEPLDEGFVVGIHALILRECSFRRVPALLLLAQCHVQYPDPGAAASIIEALNKFLNLNIDVEPLLKEAESLRLKLRELMRRTTATLSRIQKSHEYEAPPMMYI
ncbi:MAG: proteasome assembly chaperone family protein [Thermoprotei archaeon]|nr:MAG: proteasome assembly chaperone family protein [Thermoprotei archaeon]RLF20119.1 MAG: proteasome assembly chaperone family protein [Thermoprotei archaeon]